MQVLPIDLTEIVAIVLGMSVVLIPMILLYTGYSYWVFRGKVHPDDGYH